MGNRMNWEKASSISRYRDVGRDWEATRKLKVVKEKKITNKQKKFIAKLCKERGIKWENSINSLSLKQASDYINELLGKKDAR